MPGILPPSSRSSSRSRWCRSRGLRRHGPPQLRREGRWLVDPQGRVVIVHGLNLVYKRAPYVPPNDADRLHRAGRARGWPGTASTPPGSARCGPGSRPDAPGQADPAYLDQWQRVLDLLASKQHLDPARHAPGPVARAYGGEGVPDWAAVRQPPYNAAPPVVAPFPTGYWTPEVSTDVRRLLGQPATACSTAGWRPGGSRRRGGSDQPYLMGYDLLNEPWMGTEWPTCLATGCPAPTATSSSRRWSRAAAPSGAIDRQQHRLVGAAAVRRRPAARHVLHRGAPASGSSGLSWHNYCPDVFLESPGRPRRRRRELPGVQPRPPASTRSSRPARMHAVPMMSEWGATDNVRAIEIDAAVADEHLMGWTHWAYKFWNDPTTADGAQGLFRDDADLASRQAGQAAAAGPHLRPGDGRDAAGDAVRRRRPARSGSATARTAAIPRRPGSSSARSTTRTATPCGRARRLRLRRTAASRGPVRRLAKRVVTVRIVDHGNDPN